jgi:GNAT superfamily N-acetyltransferase
MIMSAVRQLPPAEIEAHLPRLAAIMKDCVEGGASVNFVLPFSLEAALAWWRGRLPAFQSGEVLLFVAEVDGTIAGTGQLALAGQPNGYQRADVAKMLVHRDYRHRGLGAAILSALEAKARALGRTTLILDTAKDSAGDRLYRRCGWTPFGVVPAYATNVHGVPEECVFFYKLVA